MQFAILDISLFLGKSAGFVKTSGLTDNEKNIFLCEDKPSQKGYNYRMSLISMMDCFYFKNGNFVQILDRVYNNMVDFFRSGNCKGQSLSKDNFYTILYEIHDSLKREEWKYVKNDEHIRQLMKDANVNIYRTKMQE